MAEYTYLAVDYTGKILGDLPLSGVSYERRLCGAGQFQAQLDLDDSRLWGLDLFSATVVGQRLLLILRYGAPVWYGFIWSRRPSSRSIMPISGSEIWSYWSHRFIEDDTSYSQIDQLVIANSILTYTMGKVGGVQTVLPVAPSSGILRDATYVGIDAKCARNAIEETAALDNGFEFTMDPILVDQAHASSKFVVGYPQLGRTIAASMAVYDWPGSILSWDWPEDGTAMGTDVFCIGSGITTRATDNVSLGSGLPLLEIVKPYRDVVVPATLQGHANADLALARRPGGVPSVTVPGDQFFGTVYLGDAVSLQINTKIGSVMGTFRLVSFTCVPEGAGGETVSLGVN